MGFLLEAFKEAWGLLLDSAVYVLFGILMAGLMRVFVNPESVGRHLGTGRFRSVLKASILGIPVPLCSCGVLPAAASLRKQGANRGATTAFLISTPESGVDSIALTYALLDPLMTVARPATAFATAMAAGIAENSFGDKGGRLNEVPDLSCPVDQCCDGIDCPPALHSAHHRFREKLRFGLKYAVDDLWNDIAAWFFIGLVLAGLITALVPAEIMTRHLGGGIHSMLIMLAAGIPLYICATASTPIAAALILKGVSPGAALAFLIAGPATNITSLTVIVRILGRRASVIYLLSIAGVALSAGLALDQVYSWMGVSAQAVAGEAAEFIPLWVQVLAALLLFSLSVRPIYRGVQSLLDLGKDETKASACGCSRGQDSKEKGVPFQSSCCSK
ncbi:MAG: SO_0444 family Cu/Zn efflux transporter [Deltaproteobacteria bacterium]|nr:SO_0444 family Cu/Zn efflux transporter [Deltaproteobacteria bacterium]MBW2137943.1 SO_0444 family Cu/Zn efflux transporter [Deltaproteobacteria bacterium]